MYSLAFALCPIQKIKSKLSLNNQTQGFVTETAIQHADLIGTTQGICIVLMVCHYYSL